MKLYRKDKLKMARSLLVIFITILLFFVLFTIIISKDNLSIKSYNRRLIKEFNYLDLTPYEINKITNILNTLYENNSLLFENNLRKKIIKLYHTSFIDDYILVKKEIKNLNNNYIDINKLINSYVKYIKDLDHNYIIFQCYFNVKEDKKMAYFKIYDMVKYDNNYSSKKYNYLLSNNILSSYSIVPINNDESIKRIGLFLENYKYRSAVTNKNFLNNFLITYKEKKKDIYLNESLFKEYLKLLWKFGLFLTEKINRSNKNFIQFVKLFDKEIDILMSKCNNYKKKSYPFDYDWFLFSSHYPTLLCYKLYIDYMTKRIINYKYIKEIQFYIPRINYSKHIKREGSNIHIMGVNYIISNIFLCIYDKKSINSFIKKIINSKEYKNNIIINYSPKGTTGLQPDGGFIFHKNLVSYNYLTSYLYPSIFYELFFGDMGLNINKIMNSLFKIIYLKTQKVHPRLTTRFGSFDEIINNIKDFYETSKRLNVFTDNSYIIKLEEYFTLKKIQKPKINIINSIKLISAIFENWNIQLLVNSNLAYGEIDIYNKQIIKQMWLSKIIINNKLNINKFESHSKYPGVLFYEKEKDYVIPIEISKGTKTFNLKNNKYSYGYIGNNTAFSYSNIENVDFHLSFNEFILIVPEGIIVAYFNINKYKKERLFLCIGSKIYSDSINYGILYSDNKNNFIINENNEYYYTEVNKNIIYYNFNKEENKINTVSLLSNIEEKYIKLKLTINDKTFIIIIDNKIVSIILIKE